MQDWPIIAPIIILVVGAVVLLLNRILGNDKLFHTQWKLVLFIFTAALFQIAILGRDYWGTTDSGLFRLNGLYTHLAFIFLIFCGLGHINMRFEKVAFETETGILQLCFAMCGLGAILANNMVVYVVLLPITFLTMSIAPLLNPKISKKSGFRAGVTGALVLIAILTISVGLIAHAADSLLLSGITQNIVSAKATSQFYVGWILHVLVLLSFLLLPPTAHAFDRYHESESWSLSAFFRMSLPLLSMLLLTKWMVVSGFEWVEPGGFTSVLPLPIPEISGALFCLTLFVCLILLLFSQKVSVYAHVLPLVGLSGSLLTTLLPGVEGFAVAQSTIYLYVFLVALLFFTLSQLQISTSANLSDLRDALQKGSVSVQTSAFFVFLVSAPTISYVGFDMVRAIVEEIKNREGAAQIIMFIGLALIILVTSVICFRLAELFSGDAKRNSNWGNQKFAEKLWGYLLVAALLILGIYPTPLYKYLSHSINLFIKNA